MPVNPNTLPSEASGPAAGYYYQLRYALLRALRALKRHPTAAVSIERLEDVAIEYESGKSDLEQLKHSLQTDKEYSDVDAAVWRTLGNWSRQIRDGAIVPGSRLFLVTNGQLVPTSGMALLGPDRTTDDEVAALTKLIEAANSSTNQTTKNDRRDFLQLPPPVRKAMVSVVTAVHGFAGLSALGDEIEQEIAFVCTQEELPRFRNELEGWWTDKVFSEWAKGSGAKIQLLDLSGRIDYLRERRRGRRGAGTARWSDLRQADQGS
ncbi:hypothetical protein LZ016_11345 [Sphingomonas sp. SM33]|uniref:Uncharacterized protein n=1 Tax=Sphingomonas telluris TaxID=2907998 RepID=A0ABS9VNY7_9SPHN|nr:hypothetical protein [Sphingomonas telluris]MCH8616691.1 hypothetical protein [Sphingomonas telluris]